MTTAKLWIGLCIVAFLYMGCKKNDLSGTPSISLKSISATVIPYNAGGASALIFDLNLKESSYNPGDTLYVIINHYTGITKNMCDTMKSVLSFSMVTLDTGIPTTTSGNSFSADLQLSFSNGENLEVSNAFQDIESNGPCPENATTNYNDTTLFSFVLGSGTKFSDTVHAGPIVLIGS